MATAENIDHRYEKLTWPQINDAVEAEKTILIPVGSIEDHGPHLPLDVDEVIPTEVCERVAKARDDTLLFPTIRLGYLPHHMDYPGGITLGWETFVNSLIDVGTSLANHGFTKLLFVNGHGSNHHLVEQATRQIVIQYPEVHAAMLSWWELEPLRETAREVLGDDERSTGHAAELETSIYLYLHPDLVDMDAAPRDVAYPENPHFYATDLVGREAADTSTEMTMMEWWSTISETGVKGDATLASKEKGERLLAGAVAGLEETVTNFREYPVRAVEDKHAVDRSTEDYDPFRPR
jgi:creatinine amidohydrolase